MRDLNEIHTDAAAGLNAAIRDLRETSCSLSHDDPLGFIPMPSPAALSHGFEGASFALPQCSVLWVSSSTVPPFRKGSRETDLGDVQPVWNGFDVPPQNSIENDIGLRSSRQRQSLVGADPLGFVVSAPRHGLIPFDVEAPFTSMMLVDHDTVSSLGLRKVETLGSTYNSSVSDLKCRYDLIDRIDDFLVQGPIPCSVESGFYDAAAPSQRGSQLIERLGEDDGVDDLETEVVMSVDGGR